MESIDQLNPKSSAKRFQWWGWKPAFLAVIVLLGVGGYSATVHWNDRAIVNELQRHNIDIIGGTFLNTRFGMAVAPKLPETYGPFLFFTQGILASKAGASLEVREVDLIQMSKLKNVIQADFWEINVSDKGLSHLAALSHLERITFFQTGTTDAGALELAEVLNIRHLSFNDVPIGDEGLRHLTKLSRLTALALNKTKVTDRGLKLMEELPNLDYLELKEIALTDKGLMHLLNCKKLKWVDLKDTQCTPAGIQKFKTAHPNRELIAYQ